MHNDFSEVHNCFESSVFTLRRLKTRANFRLFLWRFYFLHYSANHITLVALHRKLETLTFSALASAQSLITHATSTGFCQPEYEINYFLPCETDKTTTTTRCFFLKDNSAISPPIKLKLLGMVNFTIADIRYYVLCYLMT